MNKNNRFLVVVGLCTLPAFFTQAPRLFFGAKSPAGLTSKTKIKTINAVGKNNLGLMYVVEKIIAKPKIIAPATAPNKLSSPPITAAIKPRTSNKSIAFGYKK
jgi:hypothetical protein